jgi:hypothetical protein
VHYESPAGMSPAWKAQATSRARAHRARVPRKANE